MRIVLSLLIVSVLVATMLNAQAPASNPVFDIASVKPHPADGGPNLIMMQVQPGGRYTATNVTALMLIRNAYQLQSFQLVGAPDWLAKDRFDVNARAAGEIGGPMQQGPDPSPLQLMVRALLADRFRLKAHNDTRDMPVYALVVARADGKLGPRLKPSATDCAAEMAAARGRSGGAPPPMPAFGEPMKCGMRMGAGTISAGSMPMSQMLGTLSMIVNRTVVDRTGLTGNYDFDLSYTPDQLPQRPAGTPADQPLTVNGVAIDPNGPSIFTALQEQLGLKLDSTRGPVDVLVIDSIDHPSEN
jgi:uncharacterized protein (TIGR03435 family)